MEARSSHGADDERSAKLRAGVARIEITSQSPGASVRDPLYAKALVIDDGSTQLALITMDVTAIGARTISQGMLPDVSEEFLPRLRERIQSQMGIPGWNVTVNASHTHPLGQMLCDDDEQVDRVCEAVRRAHESLIEVRVGAGRGREDRVTMNRTLRLRNGKHWTIRHANPCPPDEEVSGVGPHDPEIGILRVDRVDGSPLALIYNYATHLLFGDLQGAITANFTGIASKIIEDHLGHGAMAMFIQGAAGDVVDVHFKDFGRPRDVEPLGVMLGQSTLDAAARVTTSAGVLKSITRVVELPRRTDIPDRITQLQTEQNELLESLRSTSLNFESFLPLYLRQRLNPNAPAGYSFRYKQEQLAGRDDLASMDAFNRRHIDKYLANIRAMERLTRIRENVATLQKHQALNAESGESTIRAEIQTLRIGSFVLVTAPIEVLTEVALNIKQASPHPYTFVAGFTNGYLHYGPPAADYDKGGYEVTECLLAPEWQGVFERNVKETLALL